MNAKTATILIVLLPLVTLRGDFMVNEESYRANWAKDFVAADRYIDSSFLFVWLDTRPGVPAIYGQRLSPAGVPLARTS